MSWRKHLSYINLIYVILFISNVGFVDNRDIATHTTFSAMMSRMLTKSILAICLLFVSIDLIYLKNIVENYYFTHLVNYISTWKRQNECHKYYSLIRYVFTYTISVLQLNEKKVYFQGNKFTFLRTLKPVFLSNLI